MRMSSPLLGLKLLEGLDHLSEPSLMQIGLKIHRIKSGIILAVDGVETRVVLAVDRILPGKILLGLRELGSLHLLLGLVHRFHQALAGLVVDLLHDVDVLEGVSDQAVEHPEVVGIGIRGGRQIIFFVFGKSAVKAGKIVLDERQGILDICVILPYPACLECFSMNLTVSA